MDNENTYEDIHGELLTYRDENRAAKSKKFFQAEKGGYGEGDKFLGIQVPVLRKVARKYKRISLDEAEKLLQSEYHEERLLAVFILADIFKKSDGETQEKIFNLYLKNTKHINNWDIVDSSAPQIVGAFVQNEDRRILYKLARSKNLWERRISIIATYHLIKKNDFEDALEISKILLTDEEDLIHKAVGWMLREIGNRDIAAEERFLKKHYKKMPRTMLRYAIEKFPEDRRKSYLSGEV